MKSRINTVLFAALSLLPLSAQAVDYGVNLLLNGNAEAGTASSTGAPVMVPGWTTNPEFTVIPYGAPGGFPLADGLGPPDRAARFFAGGNALYSTATQSIDVSANAADIDAGHVVCDLSGWLGGFAEQEDNAMFLVAFESASMVELGNGFLGPVTAANRRNTTGLLPRGDSIVVPAGTRSIYVLLVMQRVGPGPFNDAYADSLSVVLRGPAVVTNTADAGPGSFRDAFSKAGFISFDPKVFGAASGRQIITLLSSLPTLQRTLTISGPGANLLTIRRSDNAAEFTIFVIIPPSSNKAPTVVISGVTIANGNVSVSLGAGGAISAESCTLTVRDCLFTGNSAYAGGAIAVSDCAVELNGCTFSGNTAGSQAGAFINVGGDLFTPAPGPGVAKIINCTFSGNTSPSESGVIQNSYFGGLGGAAIAVSNSTITGNTNAFFQTRFLGNGGATISLDNSIIAGNGPSQFENDSNYPGGQYISNGYNLSSNSDVNVLNQTSDRNNTDPKLGPLQDNGGPTMTHALLPGSLAIDKGNTSLKTDQRGAPRPVDDPNSANGGGNNSDIGAFEFGSVLPSPTPTPTTAPTPMPTATPTPSATPASTATPTQTPTGVPTVLANISTRLRVGTGDNVLIGGIIVTGAQPKKIIVRAIGPSLPFADKLADPILELHDASGALLETNDNWMDSPNKQAIIDSTIPPSNPLESAIVRSVPPGSYTAIERGANNGTGIGVVEAYDLDSAADSRLANISTRGLVQADPNVLIAGTIVVGQTRQKVIIRALGPSTGVPGAIADPTLELRDGNGALLEANDNWVDSPNKQAILDSTIPPSNILESAIVRTLSAASYTAIVRGANNTTGIAVVEVYALN